ncbi:UPF0758 domain-containing protein [Escherichia coli]|uniref:UPF0758 domain-containing protein n=1 Tax=Escherichia coli TaxID=562 RepID=UPI000BE52EA2|nr:UPF0758 domain-containing protein [Escherichia coli]EFG2521912.1 hypothetical protein [Escherichia coli]MHQ06658.1 hypothetical protein [Escherichia coli]
MKNNSQLLMPREKMLKFGISALTDVELLALFLRTGTRGKDVLTLAKEMLENFGSLYGLLTSEYEQYHPSGCAEPSKADKLITERIIKSCQFMDLRVLDHIVIGRGEYVSFAERGWI